MSGDRPNQYRGKYPNSAQLVIHATEVTIALNAGGDGTYTFPSPFPNGLYGFQVTDVTNPAALGSIVVKGYRPSSGASDRTKVGIRVYVSTTGAVLPSVNVQVNITAWGW